MNEFQESKYAAIDGYLVNRKSGKRIPADEPVFVLRAQDVHAVKALQEYLSLVLGGRSPVAHVSMIAARIGQFERFAIDHPERMKAPD